MSIRAHPRPILSCPQRQPPALRHEPGFPDEPSVRDNRIIVQEHLKPTACDEPMLRNGARRQCRVIARADGAVAFQDSQELNDPHIRVRRPASLSLGAVLSCMLAGLHRPRMKSSEPCGRSTSASSRGRPRPGGRAGVSRPFVPGRLRDMDGVAHELDLDVTTRHLDTIDMVQNAVSPLGTFGAFLFGDFITHELMSPRKFKDILRRTLHSRQ